MIFCYKNSQSENAFLSHIVFIDRFLREILQALDQNGYHGVIFLLTCARFYCTTWSPIAEDTNTPEQIVHGLGGVFPLLTDQMAFEVTLI